MPRDRSVIVVMRPCEEAHSQDTCGSLGTTRSPFKATSRLASSSSADLPVCVVKLHNARQLIQKKYEICCKTTLTFLRAPGIAKGTLSSSAF
jgi:hypothetical protein